MKIEVGTEYQIAESVKRNFNSAEVLTIIRKTETIVQFTLNKHKGHGSMPIQHLQYLVKKNHLTQAINKRELLTKEDNKTQIV